MSDDEHMRKLNRVNSRIDSLDLGDKVLQKFRDAVASTNMHSDFVAFSSTISADIASHPAWRTGKARYDALLRNGKIRSAVADKRHQAWIEQAKAIRAKHSSKWSVLRIAGDIADDEKVPVDTVYQVIRPALKSQK